MTKAMLRIGFDSRLSVEDVYEYVFGQSTSVDVLGTEGDRDRIEKNRSLLLAKLEKGDPVYGATTGFGASSKNRFEPKLARRLQVNLTRYHGCGVGGFLSEAGCAATLLVRTNCLAQGRSAVSYELLEILEGFLNERIYPAIPAKGSVGASGDLTPLSYVAAAMMGERHCYMDGRLVSTSEAFRERGLSPYEFKEREALAIMNGTSVMTGLAALAWREVKRLADLACMTTGLLVELLEGCSAPFDPRLNALKPHPGSMEAAERIRQLISHRDARPAKTRGGDVPIQDCYSIRCAPQVIGVLYDVLAWSRTLIETEMNSVNDNPVFMDEDDVILNGGLFFGGHIASACDALKTALANVVNLLDRQLAVMMEPRLNGLLPENLVAIRQLSGEAFLHHGFKAMQITMSALTAECLKQAAPMSIFSRPTEGANQDVVSMGTIAARDLCSVSAMARQGLAIMAMAVRQGFYVKVGPECPAGLNERAHRALTDIAAVFHPVVEDRCLDGEIDQVAANLFGTEGLG